MKEEELFAALRLQKVKSIGPILAKKLLLAAGSAQSLFKEPLPCLSKVHGIGKQIIAHLKDESHLKSVEREIEFLLKSNINCYYFLDENYPVDLKHCTDAPLLLFSEGAINLSSDRIISIVGTRNMSNYGRDFCKQFIAELAPYNPVIISGFAYGVDICAHKEAMRNDLQTVAVLAHGLESIYPSSHKKYVHEMYQNGGVLTEFWHDQRPLREHFLQRNRIVAGLSQATVIIESANKGGSLVTADIANSYHREVFALPGNVDRMFSEGCNRLIQQHKAHMLTCAEDIISMMQWNIAPKPKVVQSKPCVQLNTEEQSIYNMLLKGSKSLDDIARTGAIPGHNVAALLLQMELKGVVSHLPGKMFTLA